MRLTTVLLAGAALVALAPSATTAAAAPQRVLLKDVSAITLSANGLTTGRRSSPVPQLRCMGGPCQWAPTSVLCSNAGFDGADVLWKCKADLENGIKLGDISVSCEGFDYPDDPYILRGSCGLEYTLTGVAKADQQRAYHTGQHQAAHHPPPRHDHAEDREGSGSSLFMWIVFGVVVYMLFKACMGGASGGGSGGGGGYGGGGFPPGGPSSAGAGFGSWGASSSNCAPPSSSSSSSGPGFWTGMAGGSALGYMLGRRSAANTHAPSYAAGPSVSSGWSSGGGSSSWGGGSSSSGGGGGGSFSTGTSSSSAFGGTKRR